MECQTYDYNKSNIWSQQAKHRLQQAKHTITTSQAHNYKANIRLQQDKHTISTRQPYDYNK